MRALRVMVTGGPAGGKSTAISQLRSILMKRSFNVFMIEENATRLIEAAGGYDQTWREPDNLVALQRAFLFFQKAQEDVFARLACLKQGPTIILQDRGILDGKVFVDDDLWEKVIAGENINEAEIMTRYDLILHMTSVAVDRPELYEFGPGSNNPSRFHDVHEARLQDARCAQVYAAHPHVVHVRTCDSFPDKIAHVLLAIEQLISTQMLAVSALTPLNLLPIGRHKVPVVLTQGWSQLLANAASTQQFVSLVVPYVVIGQSHSIIATLQLNAQTSSLCLDESFTLETFLSRKKGADGMTVFYEHRCKHADGRTARKMLTEREFLFELHSLQAAVGWTGCPSGAVIKRQLCWTDGTPSSQYFALTKYSDAADDSALHQHLDKPLDASVPEGLAEEELVLVPSTPPAASVAPVLTKSKLKIQTTGDACDLAAKRRRVHE